MGAQEEKQQCVKSWPGLSVGGGVEASIYNRLLCLSTYNFTPFRLVLSLSLALPSHVLGDVRPSRRSLRPSRYPAAHGTRVNIL